MPTLYWKDSGSNNWSDTTNWWFSSDGTGPHPDNAPWTVEDPLTMYDLTLADGVWVGFGSGPNIDIPIGMFIFISGNCDIQWLTNYSTIIGGNFSGDWFTNNGDIGNGPGFGSIFYGSNFSNFGTIYNGDFIGSLFINYSTIFGGSFNYSTFGNYSGAHIHGGFFYGATSSLDNDGIIDSGSFAVVVYSANGSIISGGEFAAGGNIDGSSIISNGTFDNNEWLIGGRVYGGIFNCPVDGRSPGGAIYGGQFYGSLAYRIITLYGDLSIRGGNWICDSISIYGGETIYGGTFNCSYITLWAGNIAGGTFISDLNLSDGCVIYGGDFTGYTLSIHGGIYGGIFNGIVDTLDGTVGGGVFLRPVIINSLGYDSFGNDTVRGGSFGGASIKSELSEGTMNYTLSTTYFDSGFGIYHGEITFFAYAKQLEPILQGIQ